MAGIVERAMEIPWQDRFAKLAGRTPEAAGVKSEEEAQDYLTRLQAMRTASAPTSSIDPTTVADIWGKTGTTNQTIKAK